MQPSVKSKGPADAVGRPLLNLRISVTDRCNLRCRYCMPEEEYGWLPREKLLSFEEISELAGIFTAVGIEKVRLTGGEPLLRKDLPVLVRMLAQNPRIRDLALTTNGVLLAGQAQALWDAGLHRLTVSLDTLRPDRFLVLTRRDAHAPVLRGIEAARQAGFRALKIDAVVVRGANEDELADLIEFGKRAGAEVRFIEYMDVGGATQWSRSKVVSRAEMLDAGRLGATLLRATAHRSPSARVLAAAQSAGHRAFFRNLCNRRERPVSNNTDPKREHDYEIVLKPPEVASFSPENKHTRTWRMKPAQTPQLSGSSQPCPVDHLPAFEADAIRTSR